MLVTSACNLLLVAWCLKLEAWSLKLGPSSYLPRFTSRLMGWSSRVPVHIYTRVRFNSVELKFWAPWPQVHRWSATKLIVTSVGRWTRAQVLAGAVIIKAHTPGAKRSSNAPDPFLCVRSFQFRRIEVWDTLITNRKTVLILDRYLANSSYENNISNPI